MLPAFYVETDPATEGTTEQNQSDTAPANKPKKIINKNKKHLVLMVLLLTVMLWLMHSLMQLHSKKQIRNAEAAVLSAPGYAAIRVSSVLLNLLLVPSATRSKRKSANSDAVNKTPTKRTSTKRDTPIKQISSAPTEDKSTPMNKTPTKRQSSWKSTPSEQTSSAPTEDKTTPMNKTTTKRQSTQKVPLASKHL
jgi:hypothetical protein